MPELPDLEIVREVLAPRLAGVAIRAARLRRPLIVRNLLGGEVEPRLVGRRFAEVRRRGKFLLLALDDGNTLVIHPMLAGRLRHGPPLERDRARDVLVLSLSDGNELRYHDEAGMGKIYLTDDPNRAPGFAEQGPDAADPALTLEVFRERLRRHSGEIKGILVNQQVIVGIGNAYADEICWRAGVYPFRRRASLDDVELERLYVALRDVLTEAVETLRRRAAEAIEGEVRDFLAVHGKAGQPCPRCGAPISEVTRQRRATNFCRHCQPGLLAAPGRQLIQNHQPD